MFVIHPPSHHPSFLSSSISYWISFSPMTCDMSCRWRSFACALLLTLIWAVFLSFLKGHWFHWFPTIALSQKLKKKPHDEVGAGTPCSSFQATADYLNQASVRRALHIPESVQDWVACSGPVTLHYTKQYHTMRPQFERVLAKVCHTLSFIK